MPLEKDSSHRTLRQGPENSFALRELPKGDEDRARDSQTPTGRDRQEAGKHLPAYIYSTADNSCQALALIAAADIVEALLDVFEARGDFARAETLAALAFAPRSSPDEARRFVGEALWQSAETHLLKLAENVGLAEILNQRAGHA